MSLMVMPDMMTSEPCFSVSTLNKRSHDVLSMATTISCGLCAGAWCWRGKRACLPHRECDHCVLPSPHFAKLAKHIVTVCLSCCHCLHDAIPV